MTDAFWRHRRVFLTGHTGFKGSWLSLWLQRLGADVVGYALAPPTTPSLFVEGRVADGMTSLEGDIRDRERLTQAMVRAEPEIVIHMAAQPLVRQSYQLPVETFDTNVMGTVHVFEAVRVTPSVRAVVNVTTDKCYENQEWHWAYREHEPLGGRDPYSSSKACSELVSAAYRASFFGTQGTESAVAVATARAGNVIGGGDWARDRLIPDIVTAFEQGTPLRIRYPSAVRPWQHVLGPLHGYLSLAERLVERGDAFAEAWNFGPADDDCRPVQWIVDRLARQWGHGAIWEVDDAPHPHEAGALKLDSSKTRERLGWQPRWNLPTALSAIVEWHRARGKGADMRNVTLAQIADYVSATTEGTN